MKKFIYLCPAIVLMLLASCSNEPSKIINTCPREASLKMCTAQYLHANAHPNKCVTDYIANPPENTPQCVIDYMHGAWPSNCVVFNVVDLMRANEAIKERSKTTFTEFLQTPIPDLIN